MANVDRRTLCTGFALGAAAMMTEASGLRAQQAPGQPIAHFGYDDVVNAMEVGVTLFPRRAGTKLGFPPLTSMFFTSQIAASRATSGRAA